MLYASSVANRFFSLQSSLRIGFSVESESDFVNCEWNIVFRYYLPRKFILILICSSCISVVCVYCCEWDKLWFSRLTFALLVRTSLPLIKRGLNREPLTFGKTGRDGKKLLWIGGKQEMDEINLEWGGLMVFHNVFCFIVYVIIYVRN